MRGLVVRRYGERPEVEDLDDPVPEPDGVRVRVVATSINASDCEFWRGEPLYTRAWGPFRPGVPVLGSDVAGVVDAVGSEVKNFRPGDRVFGDLFDRWGGLAELVCAPEHEWSMKPAHLSFEAAAALPQSGVLALQGLRDCARLQAGERVLVNGAGGGAGTFAVQIAQHLGATVTAVDSSTKREVLEGLGAEFLDYREVDFVSTGRTWDVVLDLVATRPVLRCRAALSPGGRYVLCGGGMKELLGAAAVGLPSNLFSDRSLKILGHERSAEDLEILLEWIEAGVIEPIVEKTYPFEQAAEALAHVSEGRAIGKVVVRVSATEG